MAHVTAVKSKLLARVRRIKGQVEAVERALENGVECAEMLQLVASVRGAVDGLTAELIEDHVEAHIVGVEDPRDRARGARELVQVIRTYMK